MAGAPVRSRKAERHVSFARSRQAGNLRELQELGSQTPAAMGRYWETCRQSTATARARG